MPTHVLLIRHAESTHPHVFNGAESDVGLSGRGLLQATALAPVVASMRPDVIVSSPMRRALDTARPIAGACGLALRVEPDLFERRVGALAGRTTEETGEIWPETMRRWIEGEVEYAPPGSESFAAVQRRLLPIWDRLAGEHEGRKQVVVAHGFVCRVLLLSLLPGMSAREWNRLGPLGNARITELVGGGREWKALCLNAPVPEVERVNGLAPGG